MKNWLLVILSVALFGLAWMLGRSPSPMARSGPRPAEDAPQGRNPATTAQAAPATARPAPPRFTPAMRPNNEWDREARQQHDMIDDHEANALAALDALGPRIGPPETVDTLRRWMKQSFSLKRSIFAEPVYSALDLELRYDRVRKLVTAQTKAEQQLLGLGGFNRYRFLHHRQEQGIVVTDEDYADRIAPPKKPGQRIGVRHPPAPPIDSREYDRYFTQR